VFVLAYTSNPEGAALQRAVTAAGGEVGAEILAAIARDNRGAEPFGSIGAVVGATVDRVAGDLAAVNGPLLAPGVGAQGGTVAGLRALFGDALPNVVPSVSREVLGHGPDPDALRTAADRLAGEFAGLVD
jgi:orotidine-5'-phosphate decarboxylase